MARSMEPQGGGGGPAPFLQKTYDMVDDSSTDAIVSWGSKGLTFVVWDPLELARNLLPAYFKHNNFSSFIRQLNTYGFRKVDQEKWEFANEDFVRGERHRLKNIHRKKPIHSHSQPVADVERVAFEEEIERLTKERDRLWEELRGLGKMEAWGGFQFNQAEKKMENVEQRQGNLACLLERVVQNPAFVEHLIKLADSASIDFSLFSKKRRSIQRTCVDGSLEFVDNCSNEGHSSTSKPIDFAQLFPQDFSNKLTLGLCPAVSNGNMVLDETRNSNECSDSPQRVDLEEPTDLMEHRLFITEDAELMDTSVSLSQKRNNSLPWLPTHDDEEEQNLRLTLAPLDFDDSLIAEKISKSMNQSTEETAGRRSSNTSKDDSFDRGSKEQDNYGSKFPGVAMSTPVASTANNQANGPGAGRVNDVFWEQFLTERPGSNENEEANSCFRSSSKEERVTGSETWISRKDMGAMKL